MNKLQEYQLIEEFMGRERERTPEHISPEMFVGVEYNRYIGDLWPVIAKCRAAAQELASVRSPLVKAWLAIALELYTVPTEPEQFENLYKAVVGFIEFFNQQ
jgi:hypothetical protein